MCIRDRVSLCCTTTRKSSIMTQGILRRNITFSFLHYSDIVCIPTKLYWIISASTWSGTVMHSLRKVWKVHRNKTKRGIANRINWNIEYSCSTVNNWTNYSIKSSIASQTFIIIIGSFFINVTPEDRESDEECYYLNGEE